MRHPACDTAAAIISNSQTLIKEEWGCVEKYFKTILFLFCAGMKCTKSIKIRKRKSFQKIGIGNKGM